MGNFNISVADVLFFCGLITAIWGAWKVIKEIRKPSNSVKHTVDEHEKKLTEDFKRLNSIEECNKVICKSLLALVDHEITGNGIDKLKGTKNELQSFLINR